MLAVVTCIVIEKLVPVEAWMGIFNLDVCSEAINDGTE